MRRWTIAFIAALMCWPALAGQIGPSRQKIAAMEGQIATKVTTSQTWPLASITNAGTLAALNNIPMSSVTNAGSLATLNNIPMASVTNAGSLATLSDIPMSSVTNAGSLATLSDIPMSSVTNAGSLATLNNIPMSSVTNAGALATLDAVTSLYVTDGTLNDVDVNSSAAIALTKLACAGLGVMETGFVTRTEAQSDLVLTTITITNCPLSDVDLADKGDGQVIFTVDEGAFCVLLAMADCTVVSSATCTNTFVMAIGSATAGDDNNLTSTEADVCPAQTINTTGGTVLTNAFDSVLATPINFDGSGGAKQIFVNCAIDDDNNSGDWTNAVTGTLYLITTKSVDK